MLKLKTMGLYIAILTAMSLPFSLYANAGTSGTSKETTGTYIEGSATTTKIKTKLLTTSDISSFDISVKTENGVVTLDGDVDTNAQKMEAEKVAKSVDGVKKVVNDLKVNPKTK